ncbi:Protein mono-ADP-ribosyltransferase parp4 [Phlyctochytrium planicorne]|nr:Protein mono-ADP-ribosyltransferase parp4 [Phlyctochytrium planicorne]
MIFVGKYPRRQIQVVFRLFKSPAEILMGFDIDSCCFGYNGKNVYTLPRGLRALTHRYNLVDMTRRSASYEYRLFKYAKRGFAVGVPNVHAAKIANKNRINTGQGLSRLLSLEARQLVPGYHRKAFAKDGGRLDKVEIMYADRNAEKMEQGDRYSHYQVVKIPYGEKWGLKRIQKFLRRFKGRAGYAILYGPMSGMEYRRPEWIKKRREAEKALKAGALDAPAATSETTTTTNDPQERNASGDEDEDDEDVYEQYEDDEDASSDDSMCSDLKFDYAPMVITRNEISANLDEYITEYLDNTFHFLKFEDCWVVRNPGAQLLTGSFKPVETTWEEWCRDAYDGSLPERGGTREERVFEDVEIEDEE